MIGPEARIAAVRALVAVEPAVAGAPRTGVVGWLHRLCGAAVRALPATGAGVSVMTHEGVRGVAAASDPACEALEELQFTLGEGPCIDAFTSRRPVLEADLATGASRMWPAYLPAALQHGVRAVFAFPLQVGGARMGVLDVYRRTPGILSADSLAQAQTFAEVAVECLLDGQQNASRGRTDRTLDRALDFQFVVYQAQGMAMVDLGVPLADAMVRMQAHAYVHDRSLHDVARDIVAGRLRLEADGP